MQHCQLGLRIENFCNLQDDRQTSPSSKEILFVPRDPSQLQPEPESQARERRPGTRRNYDQMQNGGGDVLLTPEDARSTSTKAAFAAAGSLGEDNIMGQRHQQ